MSIINPFVIIKQVEKHYHLKAGTLSSPKRTKMIAEARALAMYLTRELTPYSLIEIAEHFNREDHTQVVYGRRKILAMLKGGKRPDIKEIIERIKPVLIG